MLILEAGEDLKIWIQSFSCNFITHIPVAVPRDFRKLQRGQILWFLTALNDEVQQIFSLTTRLVPLEFIDNFTDGGRAAGKKKPQEIS